MNLINSDTTHIVIIVMSIFTATWLLVQCIIIVWISPVLRKRSMHRNIEKISKRGGIKKKKINETQRSSRIQKIFNIISFSRYRTNKKISGQLPVILDALADAQKAGFSFPQALAFVEGEADQPVKTILSQAIKEIDSHFSLEDVLQNMQNRNKNKDVSFITESIIMQMKTGGNMIQMLKNIAHTIRERIQLEKDIRNATAQGRLSGIMIAVLWPFSLLLFHIISPNYIDILFTSFEGKLLLAFALFLECIGFYCIWKITNIRL